MHRGETAPAPVAGRRGERDRGREVRGERVHRHRRVGVVDAARAHRGRGAGAADVVGRHGAEVVEAVAHRGGVERARVGRARRRAGVGPRRARGELVLILHRGEAAAAVGGGGGECHRAGEVRRGRRHRRRRVGVVDPARGHRGRGAGLGDAVDRDGAEVVEAVGDRAGVERAGERRRQARARGGPGRARAELVLVADRRDAGAVGAVGARRGQRDRAGQVRGRGGHRRGRRDVVEPAVRDDRRRAGVAGDVGRLVRRS